MEIRNIFLPVKKKKKEDPHRDKRIKWMNNHNSNNFKVLYIELGTLL